MRQDLCHAPAPRPHEFALQLDHALRQRGLRERAALTFVTPEPYLGHLDVGTPAARRVLERLFARRHSTALTGVAIGRVDREGVHLWDGHGRKIVIGRLPSLTGPLSKRGQRAQTH